MLRFGAFGASLACEDRFAKARMTLLTSSVGFTKIVAAVGDGEFPIRRDRCLYPIPLAIRRVLQIGDLILRGIVCRVAIEERQVALPDVFNARKLRHA